MISSTQAFCQTCNPRAERTFSQKSAAPKSVENMAITQELLSIWDMKDWSNNGRITTSCKTRVMRYPWTRKKLEFQSGSKINYALKEKLVSKQKCSRVKNQWEETWNPKWWPRMLSKGLLSRKVMLRKSNRWSKTTRNATSLSSSMDRISWLNSSTFHMLK